METANLKKNMEGKRDYSDNEPRLPHEWLQKLSMVYSLQPLKPMSDSEKRYWRQPT